MNYTFLRVRLESGKQIDYSIEFGFHDAEDGFMEAWGGSITVDLSAHTDELKKAIVKALIDKFFSNQFERGSVTASPQRERKVRKCRMKLKFFKSGADMAKVQTESRREAKRELTVLATDFGLIQMSGVVELIETATDYHEAHKKLMKIYNQKYFS